MAKKKGAKEIHVFRMDFYTGQNYTNKLIIEKYNEIFLKNYQINENVQIHHTSNELKVDFASQERPWSEWVNEIRRFSAELNELLSREFVQVILTGKTPLSMFSYFGYLISHSNDLLIANQFNNINNNNNNNNINNHENWQFFDLNAKSSSNILNFDDKMRVLNLEKVKQHSNNENNVQYHPKKNFALLFVTLNSTYSLSSENLEEISQKAIGHHGFDGKFDEYFKLSPIDDSSRPLVLPSTNFENSEEISILGDIREDIRKAYEKIRYENKLDSLMLISTGPQPLAYLLGMLFKPNLYGDFILFEKVANEFHLCL